MKFTKFSEFHQNEWVSPKILNNPLIIHVFSAIGAKSTFQWVFSENQLFEKIFDFMQKSEENDFYVFSGNNECILQHLVGPQKVRNPLKSMKMEEFSRIH